MTKSTSTYRNPVRSEYVTTLRGRFHLLQSGAPEGIPVLLVHGNVSAATFWEEVMELMPAEFRVLAPDLRGYGRSQELPVDATRGVRDFSDDLHALVTTLSLPRFHLVGHSLGGVIAMQYAIDHAAMLSSLTLVATGSPYGFGGTRDVYGTPTWPDYAGSGGGLVRPEFLAALQAGDRSLDTPFSPRNVLRQLYVHPPFISPREDALVEAMLQTSTAPGNYSRDMTVSSNWPYIAPGTKGVNNALSPKYCNLASLAGIEPKCPILWVRGANDRIVSDAAYSDPGTLGALGIWPGWPGVDRYPPQPMLGQIRQVLERYAANGGMYREIVMPESGHVPFLEQPAQFVNILRTFLIHGHERPA